MEKVKSLKGKDIYIYAGYSYRFDRTLKDEITKMFRCTNKECKGRLKDYNGAFNIVTEHNSCVSNPAKQSSRKIGNKIKKAAETSYTTLRQLILNNQPAINLEQASLIPSYHSFRQQINRIRRKKY
ncbi:hypothetical protein HZS_3986 [Henneguya salminicola]|nr:hypothetical protein HZS_3986 [Henneguya salminicola]